MQTPDISFHDYRRSNDIHGTAYYPATMVAPVQKTILERLFERNHLSSVIDPFCGSGTALYEAFRLHSDTHLIGLDINPLATLITRVKLEGVEKNIQTDIQVMQRILPKIEEGSFSFPKIEKWFRPDIIRDLRKLRQAIIFVENEKNRRFFWVMFANIVRKYSNTRSSTFKLHIKPQTSISAMPNGVISDFFTMSINFAKYYTVHSKHLSIKTADCISQLTHMPEFSIDLCITSPPYGDNATTVTYGQFSSLALMWIDHIDMDMRGYETNHYSSVDSVSMGSFRGRKISISDFECNQKELLEPSIENITETKRKKVLSFFRDYFDFLNQATRITKNTIVLTVGNRTVDHVNIPLSNITSSYLVRQGFQLTEKMERTILQKRIPARVSTVRGNLVDSMNHEYVLIFERTA